MQTRTGVKTLLAGSKKIMTTNGLDAISHIVLLTGDTREGTRDLVDQQKEDFQHRTIAREDTNPGLGLCTTPDRSENPKTAADFKICSRYNSGSFICIIFLNLE